MAEGIRESGEIGERKVVVPCHKLKERITNLRVAHCPGLCSHSKARCSRYLREQDLYYERRCVPFVSNRAASHCIHIGALYIILAGFVFLHSQKYGTNAE